jgi:hypothetical protein
MHSFTCQTRFFFSPARSGRPAVGPDFKDKDIAAPRHFYPMGPSSAPSLFQRAFVRSAQMAKQMCLPVVPAFPRAHNYSVISHSVQVSNTVNGAAPERGTVQARRLARRRADQTAARDALFLHARPRLCRPHRLRDLRHARLQMTITCMQTMATLILMNPLAMTRRRDTARHRMRGTLARLRRCRQACGRREQVSSCVRGSSSVRVLSMRMWDVFVDICGAGVCVCVCVCVCVLAAVWVLMCG